MVSGMVGVGAYRRSGRLDLMISGRGRMMRVRSVMMLVMPRRRSWPRNLVHWPTEERCISFVTAI